MPFITYGMEISTDTVPDNAIVITMGFDHDLSYDNWCKLKGPIIHTNGSTDLSTSENNNTFEFPLFYIEYKRTSGVGHRQLAFAMDAAVMQAQRIGLPSPYFFFSAVVDVQNANIVFLALEYKYGARIIPFVTVTSCLCF